jgi:gluconate 2-dehydrogenase gamma chain
LSLWSDTGHALRLAACEEKHLPNYLPRRAFLKAAATLVPAGTLAPAALARAGAAPVTQGSPARPGSAALTAAQQAFLDAAVARLIPADDLGPGAKEAGVTDFIARQLDGPYGRAQTWYMQGPWHVGADEQGYQLKLTPAQLYATAIEDIDAHCQHGFAGKTFAQLQPAEQDRVLEGLEKGDVKLARAPAKQFFELLWHNTQEGFLADPMYGGNRDFAGWKLIGFPGPRYNYVSEIDHYGKRYTAAPVGIFGRDPRRGLP